VGGNIKVDLREVGYGGMEWIDFTWDKNQWEALVKLLMNLRFEPSHLLHTGFLLG
jgi:hypothetical protein